MTITFTVPIRTSNPLNGSHQHWSVKSRKRKAERAAVALAIAKLALPITLAGPGHGLAFDEALKVMGAAGPVSVRLIRTKPRGGPMDGDGLTASLKSVRDGVALALGIDDGDTARVRFDYAEERGEWGVRVEISPAPPEYRRFMDHLQGEETRRRTRTQLNGHVRMMEKMKREDAKPGAKVQPTPATYRPGAR